MFVRGSWYKRASDYNNYFGNAYTGTVFKFLSRAGTIDDVYTLNPTTVLNVRYGYNRFVRSQDGNPESYGLDLTKLGFPASFANLTSRDQRRMPRIDITGYYGNGFTGELRPVDTHAINATLNKARGSHFIKTGMEFPTARTISLLPTTRRAASISIQRGHAVPWTTPRMHQEAWANHLRRSSWDCRREAIAVTSPGQHPTLTSR